MDDRYVNYREYTAGLDEVKAQMAALELAQAKLGASLLHLPEQVAELSRRIQDLGRQIAERPAPVAPVQDQTLLMMHRILDGMAAKNGGGAAVVQNAVVFALGLAVMWIARQAGLG